MTKTIIITGASGTVAQPVIEVLQKKYSLRLFDRFSHRNHTIEKLDIRKERAVNRKIRDADTLIHLAAIPEEDEAAKILNSNIIGTLNVFRAAHANGINRIIFASSIMAYGTPETYPLDRPLHPLKHSHPTTHYATSKLYGENLAQMYSLVHGLSTICLRLGWYPRTGSPRDIIIRQSYMLLSPSDCKRLFLSCVEAPQVDHAVVNGLSRAGKDYFDLEPGRKLLNFDPQDEAQEAVAQHLQRLHL